MNRKSIRPPSGGARIHIVEDNPDMLLTMRKLLELRGYQVSTYLRALDLLDEVGKVKSADCVISDYFLPDMNGVELLKRVRESKPGIRSLLLTGSREEHVRQAASAVPDCDVLYKPVDFETLEAHLKSR